MSAPTLPDVTSAARTLKDKVDALLAILLAKSPDVAKPEVEALTKMVDEVLDGTQLLSKLTSGFAAAYEAVKEGKSVQGGGADASLV